MSNHAAALERTLVTASEIGARVKEVAGQISNDYAGKEPLAVVGVLKGAFIFLADLTRALTVDHTVDFLALSSYGKGAKSSGAVRILMDLREPIVDQHVLIVEDIVDTGRTLAYLLQTLKGRRPASLRTCVLLRKKGKNVDVPIDYLGFEIPDVWVVGYGLDYAERYRTLPFIAELKRQAYN